MSQRGREVSRQCGRSPASGGWTRLVALVAVATLVFAGCDDDEDHQNSIDAGPDAEGDVEPGTDTDDDAGDQDGAIRFEGLSDEVTVQLDEWGVVHIECQTNADCFAAQGYFHAEHRFFMMDLIRRQTRGELVAMIGSPALDSDRVFRHLMTTAEGEPLEEEYLEQVDEETLEMLEAYADGVNAWLSDVEEGKNGAELTAEYENPLIAEDNIRHWEPEDTIALYLQLAYQLSESSDSDLFRGEMAAQLDPEMAADLFTVKPGIESNIMQASGANPTTLMREEGAQRSTLDALESARKRLTPGVDVFRKTRERLEANPSFVFGPKSAEDGSNSWAVGSDMSEGANALLADDPHLSLNNPAIWHMVEIDSKTNGEGDIHAAGASVPAVPGVVVGHNESIAWGVTTARLDLADAYLEELNDDGTAVIFDGEEVPLVEREYTFETSSGVTETETFEWVPHHGPLLEKDVDAGVGVSMRWVAQEPGNDIDFFLPLLRAESVDQARQALEPIRTINQNWTLADKEGSIGWVPEGAIPNREFASTELPNWLPLPGDGSAEWDGYLDEEQKPHLIDPPAGFIATANNDFDGSYTDGDATNDGHTPWQTAPAQGHRHKRIVEMLEAEDGHNADTMHDIQADTFILHGQILVPHILDAVDGGVDQLSPTAQEVVAALQDWNYTCPTGIDGPDPREADKSDEGAQASIGCSAFHVMLPYLTEALFGDELEANSDFDALSNWYSLQAALLYVFDDPDQLSGGDAYFENVLTDAVETRADIIAMSLERTAEELEQLFDSDDADDWRWGRIHTVSFVNLLFSEIGIDDYDEGPFANDGGMLSVDVANPAGRSGEFEGRFYHPNGPSVRLVVELNDDDISGWFQLPGGQDHHRDSPYYANLTDDWLTNTPNELLFGREEVDERAEEIFELGPAK